MNWYACDTAHNVQRGEAQNRGLPRQLRIKARLDESKTHHGQKNASEREHVIPVPHAFLRPTHVDVEPFAAASPKLLRESTGRVERPVAPVD